jgi:hypothetical protein
MPQGICFCAEGKELPRQQAKGTVRCSREAAVFSFQAWQGRAVPGRR